MRRHRILINTDPQRRCYNGCHFESELIWSPWEPLERRVPEEKVESFLAFWTDLNDYAVSCRGPSAKTEFRMDLDPQPTQSPPVT
jgi:hypothetical protein